MADLKLWSVVLPMLLQCYVSRLLPMQRAQPSLRPTVLFKQPLR